MKYEVGDTVKIKSKEWYEKNKTWNDEAEQFEILNCSSGIIFAEGMSAYCGKTATIVDKRLYHYLIDIDDQDFVWTDSFFE